MRSFKRTADDHRCSLDTNPGSDAAALHALRSRGVIASPVLPTP